ncbi:MAG: hypothetical protein CO186_10950 [Zetaproteobacteria bacterium CG_4_9_14_3_um_filter_49_83]|nr:MAG: hypothetical protein AUJ56_07865 [Zetaproteobacteria bacterium CG1_02_49_23]PIQ32057.1 MAG: hypothetical protein COW62_08315 [Zetaproteobacteria bacterium CG17_big_fil_post_rev_8_21_14_2_50_50_13]PIV30604.1 MAG: hypothetical protein COS35_05835 [Zetaproteobacteria bacterium CG02_land_8_20_14_3_00_50_9]PIY56378.1 MAG: hypothetical protein COZ00_04530 [Zetaproteobacteria bacterium CG_4_10_14_0_8_um_filter_49_80]PJA34410.1 MAG: hypothetical protein CO186_10950 [Zetaproteobacteria bacterium
MFDYAVSSGGAVSLPIRNEPSKQTEPFKAIAKASMALACSATMFMPTLSSAAVTKRAQEASFSDYAIVSEIEDGTRLVFISEPTIIAEESATGLDILFPGARSSNEYEQQLVAELINEFFE